MKQIAFACAGAAALALAGTSTAGNDPACPNPSHDCLTSGAPGCSDATCCNLVCDLDPFCCAQSWDAVCVSEAAAKCPAGPVCNDCCPADLTFDTVVDGADLGLLLAAWGTDDRCADLNGDGTVDGADLGLLLAAWGPCPTGLACDCIVADHDCCTAGGPGCTDLKCCELVCTADPFCCDTAWDNLCITQAVDACGPCPSDPACDAATHDCCTTGGPGCTDSECCSTVCLLDTFCCDNSWDLLCISEAIKLCEIVCALCPMGDHDCYTTGGAGCTDLECCEAVCATDVFCCAVLWDEQCVTEAYIICGVPACPFECVGTPEPKACGEDTDGGCNVPVIGDSNCCIAWGGLGCDNEVCAETVCAFDPFCCDVAWDDVCAAEAVQYCPDICQLGTANFATISCGETVCGTAWAEGDFRDTDWYEIDLFSGVTEGTLFSVSGTTTLPLIIGIANNDGNPDCALVTGFSAATLLTFCGAGEFEVCLPPGIYWIIVAPDTFAGFPCGTANDYSLTVACLGECSLPSCGDAGHDCLTVGGPYCDDEICCLIVCDTDPFCCDVQWDTFCVVKAGQVCYSLCPASTHDCYTIGVPGCTDNECCLAVCTVDVGCCLTAWDSGCVNQALQFCDFPPCSFVCSGGAIPEGEPCGANLNGGCNPPNSPSNPALTPILCGQTVCGSAWASNGQRDTDWYRLTGGTAGVVTMGISSEAPMYFGVVNAVNCGSANSLSPFGTTMFCGSSSVEFCYDGVEAWLFVAVNGFNGFPCGTFNGYELTVTCTGTQCSLADP